MFAKARYYKHARRTQEEGTSKTNLERLLAVLAGNDRPKLVAATLYRQVDKRTDAVALHEHVHGRRRRLDLESLLELSASVRTEADKDCV